VVIIKGVVRKEKGERLFVKSLDKEIIYKVLKSNLSSRDGVTVEFDKDKAEESEFRFPDNYKHNPDDKKTG
jgi:hypothetical protein